MLKADHLTALGLEFNEARVYLSLLELGPSTVTEISRKSGINRTTGYDILERLCVYGLVRAYAPPGQKKQFTAESPTRFLQWLEGQKRTAEKNYLQGQDLLPLLTNLYKTEDKPSITFYEGLEGAQKIFNQTLESQEEILCCVDISRLSLPYIEKYAKWYMEQRRKKKLHTRILLTPEGNYESFIQNHPAKRYTTCRLIPKTFPLFQGAEINIFEDKIVILIMTPPHFLGIQIQSAPLTQILKTLYEMAWASGEEVSA